MKKLLVMLVMGSFVYGADGYSRDSFIRGILEDEDDETGQIPKEVNKGQLGQLDSRSGSPTSPGLSDSGSSTGSFSGKSSGDDIGVQTGTHIKVPTGEDLARMPKELDDQESVGPAKSYEVTLNGEPYTQNLATLKQVITYFNRYAGVRGLSGTVDISDANLKTMEELKDNLRQSLQGYITIGGDLNVVWDYNDGTGPHTFLQMAIVSGDPDMVQMLLQKGVQVPANVIEQALEQYNNFLRVKVLRGERGRTVQNVDLQNQTRTPKTVREKLSGFLTNRLLKNQQTRENEQVVESFIKKQVKDRIQVIFDLYASGAKVTPKQQAEISTLESQYASLWQKVKNTVGRFFNVKKS